jgi:hypothetical protein
MRSYAGPGKASVTAQAHQTVFWRVAVLMAAHFRAFLYFLMKINFL